MSPARIAGVYGPTGFDMAPIVVAKLPAMAGAIIILVVLFLVFPVAIIMSGAVFAAMIGTTTKNTVDAKHKGSELLKISQSNPYGR